MLLTDSASIRDVLLFPTMKPLGSSDNKKINDIPENNDREEVIDFSKVEIEPLFKDYVLVHNMDVFHLKLYVLYLFHHLV